MFYYLQINKPPIKYSSDPPYEIPSQQDNEIHDIIFRYGYKWHVQTRQVSIYMIIIFHSIFLLS